MKRGILMLTLGVIGSPRKKGLTSQLVNQALDGAASGGSEIHWLYLIDYEIQSFPRSVDNRYEDLDKLVAEGDAMVIGSPVYYKDVTGIYDSHVSRENII
jgi:multimeric flavodoxin WrbA